jgi:hypothetical protein
MQTFWEWLVAERRQELVPQEVLDSYEAGFRSALQQLLSRVRDPQLRSKFQKMLDCPIRDSRGRCYTFTDYILSVLVRHQIHRVADIEDSLAYIYQTLMLDTKMTGTQKSTVFGGFNFDRDIGEGNPLEARFRVAVGNAVKNIASGRIRRLLRSPASTISADDVASRPDHDREFGELTRDITTLLSQKEKQTKLPLVGLFNAIIAGETTAEQRRLFGRRAAEEGRRIVVETIKEFARRTGDVHLLGLFAKLDQPAATSPKPQTAIQSPKQRDYASILQVLDRLGRPCGTADFGRFRRRWLEYPPREITGVPRNEKDLASRRAC